jgi:hypothetical protein
MYQQAPYVSLPGDVKDLLLYAKFWLELVHHHHSMEEDELFPAIAGIAGKQGVMDVNIEQHDAFGGGMNGFEKYVKAGIKGEPFEEKRFTCLIDGFGAELSKHLGDEIITLLALDIYDIKAVRKEYDNFDRRMRSGPKVSSHVYRKIDFYKVGLCGFYRTSYIPSLWGAPIVLMREATISRMLLGSCST